MRILELLTAVIKANKEKSKTPVEDKRESSS